jgi:hypothetical protein
MGMHDGKSISKRNLNENERKYLENLEGWFIISLLGILAFIFGN